MFDISCPHSGKKGLVIAMAADGKSNSNTSILDLEVLLLLLRSDYFLYHDILNRLLLSNMDLPCKGLPPITKIYLLHQQKLYSCSSNQPIRS